MLSKELFINRILEFSNSTAEIGAALLDRMSDSLLANLLDKPSILVQTIYPNKQLDARHLIIEKQISTPAYKNLPLRCRKAVAGNEISEDFVFYLKTIISENGALYYILGQYGEHRWLLLEDYFYMSLSSDRDYVTSKITDIDSKISLLY